MKNTKTIAISIPVELSAKIDVLVDDLGISRSSFLTAIINYTVRNIADFKAKENEKAVK